MMQHEIAFVADQVLPLDGPHRSDQITAAAQLVAEMVRRLNHATVQRDLIDVFTLCSVVGELTVTAERLPELLGRLSGRAGEVRDMAGVGSDDGRTPQELADIVEARLHDAAMDVDDATVNLRAACSAANHLRA